jgi:hypothetical protein
MTGQRDVLRGFGNSAINALMLQAAAEVRACREVIREAGPDMAGDLQACTEALDSLKDAIDRTAAAVTLAVLDPYPAPYHARKVPAPRPRHLQVVSRRAGNAEGTR